MDSFDHYSFSEFTRKWSFNAGTVTIVSDVSKTGPQALRLQNFGNGQVNKSFDDQATWIVGFALQITSLGTNDKKLRFEILDNTTVQCSVVLNSTGTLEFVRSTSTAVTNGTSSSMLSADTWYYVEFKVTIANSIGANTAEINVNGANWVTVDTGQDLQVSGNATANKIQLFNQSTGGPNFAWIDDLYIFDSTGSENNDFAGEIKIVALFPDGNGDTSDFVGSDADSTDNYLHVDEALTDDDSTYVESSTATDIDLYTFDDLAQSPDAIPAIQLNNVVKKDDVGSRTIRSVTRPVATNYFGASKAPSAGSYTNEIEIYDLNPETAAAWTGTLLDATEFGIEVET